MTNGICGLDFGTSNSTLSIVESGRVRMAQMERDQPNIPSAIFFDFEEGSTHFGRDAIDIYMEAGEGRMMRALKSILGTSTMAETTMIDNERRPFTDILGIFLAHMKRIAEAQAGDDLTHVVMGRPVNFVDNDKGADREGEKTLCDIAHSVGFKHVEFEFEPVAAAREFASSVKREELALIIDIGGGTSDFTILKLTPDKARQGHAESTILANAGIHIGGTDFDRWLSLAKVMPHLGYQSPMSKEGRLMPVGFYHDLATWQKINFLYNHKARFDLKQLQKEAKEPHLIDRFLHLLEMKDGHRLALSTEEAKIALSDKERTVIHLDFIEEQLKASVTSAELADALHSGVGRIEHTIAEALVQAGVDRESITALFLTGGSTRMPLVRRALTRDFPNAEAFEGDAFGSVGRGLGLIARDRFTLS